MISNDPNWSKMDLWKDGFKAQQTAYNHCESLEQFQQLVPHCGAPIQAVPLTTGPSLQSIPFETPPSQCSHCQQPPLENWHSEDWKHPRAWLKAVLTHVWWWCHHWAVAGWRRCASHARLLHEDASRRWGCHNHHQPNCRFRWVKLIRGSLGCKYSR